MKKQRRIPLLQGDFHIIEEGIPENEIGISLSTHREFPDFLKISNRIKFLLPCCADKITLGAFAAYPIV